MNTKDGKELKVGHVLQSSLFIGDDESKKLWCIAIQDNIAWLRGFPSDEVPKAYNQQQLNNSYWIIVDFKDLKETTQK